MYGNCKNFFKHTFFVQDFCIENIIPMGILLVYTSSTGSGFKYNLKIGTTIWFKIQSYKFLCRLWSQVQDFYNSSIRSTFWLQGSTRLSNNLYSQIQDKYKINTGHFCEIVLPKRICSACKAIHSHIYFGHFWWWASSKCEVRLVSSPNRWLSFRWRWFFLVVLYHDDFGYIPLHFLCIPSIYSFSRE